MNPSKVVFFLVQLWLWIGMTVLAPAQVSNIHFKTIPVKQGMAHISVFCVLQDSRGYMWLAPKAA